MKLKTFFKELSPEEKKSIILFLVSYFIVLLNYALMRSVTTSLFLDGFGAKSSPYAWLYSIVFLTISVFVSNKLQENKSAQEVFAWVSGVSGVIFGVSFLGFFQGFKIFSFASFIWKEVYIVMQVHLLLAYSNSFLSREHFKMLLGPVGAIGSLGGVLGGVATAVVAKKLGNEVASFLAVVLVLVPGLIFYFTPHLKLKPKEEHVSPLKSLDKKEIRTYVLLTCSLVMLAQFIINIADFKFNLLVESSISSGDERTSYLGLVQTWTNSITFLFHSLVVPWSVLYFREKTLQFFIPLSYLTLFAVSSLFGLKIGLWEISAFFIYLKACDYSLFNAYKELLYQPLSITQKYGAKYLTDMIAYRLGKAMIALILIYVHSERLLDIMVLAFIAVWMMAITVIFRLKTKTFPA